MRCRIFILLSSVLFVESVFAASDSYIDAAYQRVTQRVGGAYGTFRGSGFRFGLGKKFGILGIEGFYGENSENETKVFYGQGYSIDVDEWFVGGALRIFPLPFVSLQAGYARHNRKIVVPPGCPFQDEFVLDDACYGPILGAGLNLPLAKMIELHADFVLGDSCNQKQTIEAGLRINF